MKAHLTHIFRELDVTDHTQAALWATRHGVASGPNTPQAQPIDDTADPVSDPDTATLVMLRAA